MTRVAVMGAGVTGLTTAYELADDEAKAIVRELKAVGGDLRALRLALTGAERGPELAAVLAALSREDALARIA